MIWYKQLEAIAQLAVKEQLSQSKLESFEGRAGFEQNEIRMLCPNGINITVSMTEPQMDSYLQELNIVDQEAK